MHFAFVLWDQEMNKKFWDTFVCPRALLEKLNNRAQIIYKRTPDKLFGQDSIYSHHTSDNVDSRLPDVSLKTSGLCFFTRNETKPNTMLLKGMVLWTAKWYNVKKSRCNENNERLFTFALEFLAHNFTLKYEFECRRYRNDYINISLSFGFRFS